MTHPGAWICWAAAAGIAAMSTTNPFYLVVIACIAWLVYAACRIEHPAARSFRVFLTFAAVTLVTRTALVLLDPAHVSASSVATAALEGMRLGVMLLVFGAFNSVTDPYAILRLSPRRFHEPALAAALALSIAPRTIDAAAKVREAQRLRGIDTTRGRGLVALVVPVLENGLEEAVTLAESMDARGHGRGRRSRYRTDGWTWRSSFVTMTSLAGAVAMIAAGRSGFGDVSVSTYPLLWPDASPLLVAALMLFALPAWVAGSSSGVGDR